MKVNNKFLCVPPKGVLWICVLCGLIITSQISVAKSQPKEKTSEKAPAELSTAEGLIKYIKPLPAVKDVRLWQNPYGSGLVIETAHYQVYTTLLEPLMLKQVPAFVEAAWLQYQGQLPQPIQSTGKFKVYIFSDRDQWEKFTQALTGPQFPVYQKIKKGAYFFNDSCVAYNIGRARTFSVIGHEGWHQFCNTYFRYRLPSWLDEGIAQQFEASDLVQGKFVFQASKNMQRLGSLKLTMQNNKMIPIEKLISLNPGLTVLDDQSDAATTAFYAESYALVRFLREANYGQRLGNYYQMMLGALNGTWPISAADAQIASNRNMPMTAQWNSFIAQKLFNIYIDRDFKKIQNEFELFCGKITYPITIKSVN